MAQKKLGISKSEMLQMREQGMSNNDIAHCLEISPQTVYRYIGKQGGRMEHMAAFAEPKKREDPIPEETPKQTPIAVDRLKVSYEILESAEGLFSAEVDYASKTISGLGAPVTFDHLPEFVTFVVGLAARIDTTTN